MKKVRNQILVIIPAYNEGENIEEVVEPLINQYHQYDYIIINDGSTDQTEELCRERGYHAIHLSDNQGLSGAFKTGLLYAYRRGYEYALQFDGDGQHRPEYIEMMYEEMKKGYDIVIGSRFVTNKKPHTSRMLGSRLLTGVILLTTGRRIQDPTSGMRMFHRNVMKEFVKNMNYAPEPDTLSYLLKRGYRIAEIPVSMDERKSGASYLNSMKSISYMVKTVVSILLIQSFRKR